MIPMNINVEDGLVNGVIGILRHIEVNSVGEISILWIEFQSMNVGRKRRDKLISKSSLKNVSENWIPIVRETLEIQKQSASGSTRKKIIRKQFPLTVAESLTVHKSQGQTFKEVCVDMRDGQMDATLKFVALSRTDYSGLYILGEFKKPKGKGNVKAINEFRRLEKEASLQLCFNTLKSQIDGFTIVFQNINSFLSKCQFIMADEWYGRADVLVFCEANVDEVTKDHVPPNFDVLFPIKNDNQKSSRNRGLVILAKPAAHVVNLSKIDVLEGSNFHVDLRSFEIGNHVIITGYKSPSTNATTLFICLQQMISKVLPNKQLTLIGDLNLESGESNKFQNQILKKLVFPKNFSFSSYLNNQLNIEDETTIRGTQIDVVFSTSDEGYAGVYPTYFSDHNAVFYRSCKPSETEEILTGLDASSAKTLMFKNTMQVTIHQEPKSVKNMCCFNTLVHGFLEIYDLHHNVFEQSSNELFNLIHKLIMIDSKDVQKQMWFEYLHQYSKIEKMINEGDMTFSSDEMIETLLGQNYSSFLVQFKCWSCRSEKVIKKSPLISLLRATSYDIRYLQKTLLKGKKI